MNNYFIYILYSSSIDKYYVGYSSDWEQRFIQHNSAAVNSFTAKGRPWSISAVFAVGSEKLEALAIEKFIKAQKSRKFIEKLLDPLFIPNGNLGQMVRVSHLRS